MEFVAYRSGLAEINCLFERRGKSNYTLGGKSVYSLRRRQFNPDAAKKKNQQTIEIKCKTEGQPIFAIRKATDLVRTPTK